MTGAVVLAAGYSSRMGTYKPLLDVQGVPALARCIRCMRAAGAETAVVTGFRRELLAELIAAEGVVELYNPDFDKGMFTSIQAGVRYFAARRAEGLLLLPGDCPAVPVEAVRALLARAGAAAEFAVLTYRGKKGHPLWIPARYFSEILAHDGTEGLKGVTRSHEETMLRIETPFEGVVLDMDVPADYEKLLRFRAAPTLAALAAGRRFFLVRHGATVLHSGKVVMGRYDARLSELGRAQMEALAVRLAEAPPRAAAVYHSDLSRARDSAEILGRRLGLGLTEAPGLAELSLGAWDGMLIEDVKRKYPAEYARRGQYLMSYKFDNASESFYDLQYRAEEALKSILAADGAPDILLVSHAGVIKCLYGKLHGRDIDWAFSRCAPEKGELVLCRCD